MILLITPLFKQIQEPSHSLFRLIKYVTEILLENYSAECTMSLCYVYKQNYG